MEAQLAKVVKEARLKKKLSQTVVASALGATVGFVGKIERGQTGIKTARLKSLSKILKVPLKHLVVAKVADYRARVLAQLAQKN